MRIKPIINKFIDGICILLHYFHMFILTYLIFNLLYYTRMNLFIELESLYRNLFKNNLFDYSSINLLLSLFISVFVVSFFLLIKYIKKDESVIRVYKYTKTIFINFVNSRLSSKKTCGLLL